MKAELKEIGFRLTELSEYLQISRPTLYKYIEEYESDNYSQIRSDILLFFSFIDANPDMGKRTAIQFIIEHTGSNSENLDELIKTMESFGLSQEKTDFILSIVTGDWFDDCIPFLNEYRISTSESVKTDGSHILDLMITRSEILKDKKEEIK